MTFLTSADDTIVTTTHRRAFTLAEAPPISFGLAGKLSPHKGDLTITESNKHGRSVSIKLRARNRHGIEFSGTWTSPTTTKLHPQEQGYGGAGNTDELPDELRSLIESLVWA